MHGCGKGGGGSRPTQEAATRSLHRANVLPKTKPAACQALAGDSGPPSPPPHPPLPPLPSRPAHLPLFAGRHQRQVAAGRDGRHDQQVAAIQRRAIWQGADGDGHGRCERGRPGVRDQSSGSAGWPSAVSSRFRSARLPSLPRWRTNGERDNAKPPGGLSFCNRRTETRSTRTRHVRPAKRGSERVRERVHRLSAYGT
jgi:hypothetical protein